ncbi:sensor domain-containing diguanylate cyclase [Xanthomonas nasturtii]|uniref:sensor domain-containing diguanylate cyclase n=1 Tax=Xanthomonas nasturtii TaxID=1843581 RepID=UPI002B2355C8|nr:sensor domain-containing diguanylate cyclase [Xanthomonas nasturtii]MEA9580278.1 sensor domain-containing diguanylate cyclase [Xanthomonas nasturtii]
MASIKQQRLIIRSVPYFAVAMIVLLLGTNAYQAWIGYDYALKKARETTENLSHSIAQHAEDAIKGAEILSLGVVERIEGDGLENIDKNRLQQLFRRQLSGLPELHGIFVYDENGNWVVTDKDVIPASANNSDREYFIYHKEHADEAIHVGDVITSRSTGELIIPVSRRINKRDGSFGGVFLVTLRVKYFSDFYAQFQLEEQGVVVLSSSAGKIMVRHPFDPANIGKSIAQGDIFRMYLPHSPSGVAIVVSITDKVERMYGYERLGRYPLVVLAGKSKQAILAAWYASLYRSLLMLCLILFIPALFVVLISRQVRQTLRIEDELRLAYAAVEAMAMQDSLTGLANRRQLDAVLPAEIGRARRTALPLGVIMVDIDQFKLYNDRYGHPAGDLCIKAVANVLKNRTRRAGNLAARYGGEELTVLLPSSDWAALKMTAERMVQRVAELSIEHLDSPYGHLTISVGACLFDSYNEDVSADELLRQADEALYAAKQAGRNCVRMAQRL